MDDNPTADWFAHVEGDPWAHSLRRFAARARRGAGFDPTHEEPGSPFGGNPFSWTSGQPHRRPPFGGPRFGRFGPFGPFGPGSGRGPRMRRGDVRAAILALLREQQRNGYQIIQEIERRSSGLWKPSAGSVYPALQQLEDEGLIEAVEDAGRREFRLTDAGRAYADAHPDELAAPWASVAGSIDEDFALALRDHGRGRRRHHPGRPGRQRGAGGQGPAAPGRHPQGPLPDPRRGGPRHGPEGLSPGQPAAIGGHAPNPAWAPAMRAPAGRPRPRCRWARPRVTAVNEIPRGHQPRLPEGRDAIPRSPGPTHREEGVRRPVRCRFVTGRVQRH